MVGIFSRFSAGKAGHRRSQSALDVRNVLPPSLEVTTATTLATAVSVATHAIEIAFEFKPVQHPAEPVDLDLPIQCPLPEPSILNDGRIWKERVCSGISRKSDLRVMQGKSEIPGTKPRPPCNRAILPSLSAPEHSILKLLEECNASSV